MNVKQRDWTNTEHILKKEPVDTEVDPDLTPDQTKILQPLWPAFSFHLAPLLKVDIIRLCSRFQPKSSVSSWNNEVPQGSILEHQTSCPPSLLQNRFIVITLCLPIRCTLDQLSSPSCHVQNQRLPWKPLRGGDHSPSQDARSGRQRHGDRQSHDHEQQWGEPAAIRGEGSRGGGAGGQESGLLLPMQEEEVMEGLWRPQKYLFSSLLRPFSESKVQKQGTGDVKNVDKITITKWEEKEWRKVTGVVLL